MNDIQVAFALVVGVCVVLLSGFWVLVLRIGLSPVRRELQHLVDEVRTLNEISLDDELRGSA